VWVGGWAGVGAGVGMGVGWGVVSAAVRHGTGVREWVWLWVWEERICLLVSSFIFSFYSTIILL